MSKTILKKTFTTAIITILTLSTLAIAIPGLVSASPGLLGDVSKTLNDVEVFPAMAVFEGELYVSWGSAEGTGSYKAAVDVYYKTWDGTAWSTETDLAVTTAAEGEPTFAVFQNKLYVAYRVVDPPVTNYIYYDSFDGTDWAGAVDEEIAGYVPSIAVFEDKLYLAYSHGTAGVEIRNFDGTDWSSSGTLEADLGGQFGGYPALAVYDGKLWAAYHDLDAGEYDIFIESSEDGTTWTTTRTTVADDAGVKESAPALTVHDGLLYLAYEREDHDIYLTSFDGTDWSTPLAIVTSAEASGAWGTALVSYGGELYIAVSSYNLDQRDIYLFPSTSGIEEEYYVTGDTPLVTVIDGSSDKDPIRTDSITGTVTSTNDPSGIELTLNETGVNTGIFTASFPLVPITPAPSVGELGVVDGDTITMIYEGLTDTAIVDDTAPVVVVDTLTDFVAGETVTISATITEDYDWTASFQVDGSEIGSKTGSGGGTRSVTWDTTEYDDGPHTISVVVTDGAGNSGTDSESTSVDNTPPSVTDPAASPPIIGKDVSSTVVLTATVTDSDPPGSGVLSVTVDCSGINKALDVEMLDGADGTYTAELTGVDVSVDDTYELPITATDAMGNVNNLEFITLDVVDDTEAPTGVSFTSADPICGGLIIKGLDAEDPLSGVKEYVISVDGVGLTTISEADLTSTTWSANSFQRITVLDLSAYQGETVVVTVVARDFALNDAEPITLYEDEIPEGMWIAIELEEGYNLMSLPLIPDSTAREDILGLVLNQGASGVIVTYGYNQTIDDWIPDPAEMTDGWGYWLYVLEYDVLIVQGTETPEPPALPPTYEFTEGWVLGGFKSTTTAMDISDYIVSLEEDSYLPYVYVWNAETQIWEMRDTTTDDLDPGEAFWIWMYEDQYLIPPI